MSTAAIYARKSKATDKGESIENQISRGKALCQLRGWDYVIYEDYDVSGKTLERPDFERMMKDIYSDKINFVVCYKLDRISRSVNNFSNLIEELNSLDVGFICIKDNFDTSTPMGRAMMYITSVFAQLERETIAERVRDNMFDRAKLGKWNGGPIPFGFDAEKNTIEYNGKNKKVSKLIVNNKEAVLIKEFFEWYLESDGSIRSCVTRANELGYKTKNDAYWSHNQMSRILQNCIYCIADQEAYEYFKNNTDVNIVNDKDAYDGAHGLMFYNRRKPHKKTSRQREESEWILVIGEHKGIISGEAFNKVQKKLSLNKSKAPRTGQSIKSPLVGLVKCGRCGASMSIFSSAKNKTNKTLGYYHYFRCITREQKAKILCDNSNIRADLLEDLIVNHITSLLDDENSIESLLNNANSEMDNYRLPLIAKRNKINSELANISKEIDNLVNALGKGTLPEVIIKKKYKELETKKIELRKEYNKIDFELSTNYTETYNIDFIKQHLSNFKDNYAFLDLEERKKLLYSIVKEITVDKNNVKLELYFLPGMDCHADCLHTHKGSCWQLT